MNTFDNVKLIKNDMYNVYLKCGITAGEKVNIENLCSTPILMIKLDTEIIDGILPSGFTRIEPLETVYGVSAATAILIRSPTYDGLVNVSMYVETSSGGGGGTGDVIVNVDTAKMVDAIVNDDVKGINRRMYITVESNQDEIIVNSVVTPFGNVSALSRNELDVDPYIFSVFSTDEFDNGLIRIEGLDALLNPVTEFFTVIGIDQTPHPSTIFHFTSAAIESGFGDTGNRGKITIRSQNFAEMAVIAQSEGSAEFGIITIPEGYTGYLIKVNASTSKFNDIKIRYRVKKQGTSSFVVGSSYVITQSSNQVDLIRPPLRLDSGTKFLVTAEGSTASTYDCYVQVDIALVKNEVV